MARHLAAGPIILVVLVPLTLSPSWAEVIAEDKGLYKKEKWNITKRYDDLDNPHDAPGIITKGHDPANPSGPAVDFEEPLGSSNPDPEADN